MQCMVYSTSLKTHMLECNLTVKVSHFLMPFQFPALFYTISKFRVFLHLLHQNLVCYLQDYLLSKTMPLPTGQRDSEQNPEKKTTPVPFEFQSDTLTLMAEKWGIQYVPIGPNFSSFSFLLSSLFYCLTRSTVTNFVHHMCIHVMHSLVYLVYTYIYTLDL